MPPRVPPAPIVVLLAAACGAEETPYERETLAAGASQVAAFVRELDAGRPSAALARTSAAFRAEAQPASVAAVHGELTKVLGRVTAWGAWTLDAPVAASAASATLSTDATFERGTGRVRARLVRPPNGPAAWALDGYEVRGAAFTWTFRVVGRE